MFVSTHSPSTLMSTSFRTATASDSPTIAELFQIASDGVVDYVWQTLKPQYPSLTPLQIGAIRYANPESIFGYPNAVLAEQQGKIMGMMVTFPVEHAPPSVDDADDEAEGDRPTPEMLEPDVLAPYNLEAPGSWYIAALALFPLFRGQGIGTQFLQLAHQQAAQHGFNELSLLCFEQNEGALRLYQRHGFTVIERAAVVPHPLIHYTGNILLMTAPVHA